MTNTETPAAESPLSKACAEAKARRKARAVTHRAAQKRQRERRPRDLFQWAIREAMKLPIKERAAILKSAIQATTAALPRAAA